MDPVVVEKRRNAAVFPAKENNRECTFKHCSNNADKLFSIRALMAKEGTYMTAVTSYKPTCASYNAG